MSDAHLRHYDPWSIAVIFITLALFIIALTVKGLPHEILLETGIFMVSVKLILLSHKNITASRATDARLREMQNLLQEIENSTCHSAQAK
jgi:hypothetical protein